MEAAKDTVKKFIGRSGHHDTEVDEHVNAPVTSETVKPHRHEETQEAIDREVHQHHYHTTVQPLQHKEVLPEQHTHQQMPVQEREFTHGDSSGIKAGVEREAAKFADSSTTHQTTHTQSAAAVAAGEHVHHHVHETVQPVIHKETVQPEVVHTTVPIHEVHHAQAEHHGLSTLPTKTLSEFQELGGKLTGNSHRHEEYEGHPRPYNPSMQESRSGADVEPASHDGLHGSHGTGATRTTGGLSGSTGASGTTGTHVSGVSGSTGVGHASSGLESTGTALGGRTEGNTGGRALHAAETGALGAAAGTAAGHHNQHGHHSDTVGTGSTTGAGPGAAVESTTGHHGHHGHHGNTGTEGTTSRGLEHSTEHGSTGGVGSHHDRSHADTSSSTNTGAATTGHAGDDVQTPQQGKDPSLIESNTRSSGGAGLKGEGVDGSHSAVFGLTPDGHKYDDTTHGSTPLKPAHSSTGGNSERGATGDTGSRAATGAGVAEQMHDPRVAEKAHGGLGGTDTSTKPGAGSLPEAGSQGLGEVRPGQHGGESKLKDKIDPTTDADGDGKRGVLD